MAWDGEPSQALPGMEVFRDKLAVSQCQWQRKVLQRNRRALTQPGCQTGELGTVWGAEWYFHHELRGCANNSIVKIRVWWTTQCTEGWTTVNCPHRLLCLSTWFPAGGAVCRGCRSLMDRARSLGQALKVWSASSSRLCCLPAVLWASSNPTLWLPHILPWWTTIPLMPWVNITLPPLSCFWWCSVTLTKKITNTELYWIIIDWYSEGNATFENSKH